NNYSESIYSAIVVNLQMHLSKHLWKYILVIAEEFNGSPLDTEQKKILKQVKKDILTQPPSVRMPQNQINLYTTNPETDNNLDPLKVIHLKEVHGMLLDDMKNTVSHPTQIP